ncbi:MAG: ATP-binding protein [Myxococcota bacterium]
MQRSLEPYIIQDLGKKIILITGPRQCGKTTLSKSLSQSYDYLNWDASADRLIIRNNRWDRQKEVIIFDELHKMPKWKSWLKGIYDTQGLKPNLLVTGSAKLDTYRKVGDSLAGRYFQYRLHPFTAKELKDSFSAEEACERLLKFGGFPEPFLSGTERDYNRWRRSHLDIILRQDMLDLEVVRDIQGMETLTELLRYRVGSPISSSSLARDLQRDPKTVKKWLQILENLYVIFKVPPYHKNAARVLLKEPKYYFFDNAQVANNEGAKLENLVATSLKRELEFIEDTEGTAASLYYTRSTDGKEIDFLITQAQIPTYLIEVKQSDSSPAKAFKHFHQFWPTAQMIQLVYELNKEQTVRDGPQIRSLATWISELSLI